VGREAITALGITNPRIAQNLSVAELVEKAVMMQPLKLPASRETLSSTGAMIAYSDKATGRTPKAKRVVVQDATKEHVWWGDVDDPSKSPNMPISEEGWRFNYNRGIAYLNSCPQLFVVDGFASWDERYKLTVRVICSRAYHAMFMRNMLIRPTMEQIEADFKEGADWTILNAGEFPADPNVPGVKDDTSVNLNIGERKLLVLGS
jgi:phosphoenolpyruvate carboxykinase (ATP)